MVADNPAGSDPAMARLQDADPARSAEPERDSLRAKVSGLIDGDAETVVALPERRSRRGTWLVAAAVTGVLALTAGSFLMGRQSAPDPVAARTIAPAISLGSGAGSSGGAQNGGAQNGSAQNEAAEIGGAEIGGAAAAGGAPASADAVKVGGAGTSYLAGGWMRTVFHDGGVSGGGGTATGYGYDAAAAVGQEAARTVAQAFGVSGDPREEYGSWTVGSTDGSGPSVYLGTDGLASFSFSDPTAQLLDCSNVDRWYAQNNGQDDTGGTAEPAAGGEAAATAGSADGSGAATDGPPDCITRDVGPAPTGDAAAARVNDLISALGMDPQEFVLTEEPIDDGTGTTGLQTQVSAERLIGDQRSGNIWGFSFVGDDLSWANGSLAQVTPLGDYPVITAAEAVQRLNDPRFGPANVVYPLDYVWADGEQTPADAGSAPTLPAAGATVPWAVSDVTIVSAQLGVAPQYLANGAVLLVPAYALTDDEGVNWSVIAVADSALDFAAK